MRHPSVPRRGAAALLVAGAVVVPLVPAVLTAAPAAAAPTAAPAVVRVLPAQHAVLHRGDAAPGGPASAPRATTSSLTVVPGVPGPAVSRWQVTYTGFTPQAKAAFQKAVDLWAGIVRSPVPITVTASMRDLGDPTLLGQTGPGNFYAGAGIGDGRTYYPSPLADALAGRDVQPPSGPAVADIDSEFNSAAGGLYYGTDGRPGPGQVDFTTVVLHELGHGLGFIGSMDVDTAGRGSYEDPPDVYDLYTLGPAGTRLIDQPNGSLQLGAQLQSASVTWSGARAARRNAGVRPKLYAPAGWQPGSSYAHLDESTYPRGTAESLMTPVLTAQEVVRDPGAITRGLFADMGWSVVQEQAERGTWSSSSGTVEVAERRADGSVDLRTLTSAGLSQPELLGGQVLGAPAVVRRPSGALEVYVRGTDNQLYVKRRPSGGSFTDWVPLGGVLGGAPGVSLFKDDEVHVFVRGSDAVMYHRWSSSPGSYTGWESLGGLLRLDTAPAVTSPATGRLEVVVQGTDRASYRKSFTGTWQPFAPFGGQVEGTPAIAAPGGTLVAVVRGTDSLPYARTPTTDWAGLGGVVAGSPSVAWAPGSSRADAYATGTDSELYTNSWTGGRWSGWSQV